MSLSRITDGQIIGLTQYDLNTTYENLSKAQTVLSTGKQINTPADNPIGTATALQLQGYLDQSNQFSATVSNDLGWLQTTTSAFNDVSNALTQMRTMAVQGANATLTDDQRQALAATVGQLLQQAVQDANTTYEGKYVLSGTQTGTQPFTLDTSTAPPTVTYHGDSQAMQHEVSPARMVQVNVPGSTALPAAFAAMAQIQQDLQTGNPAALGGADLQTADDAHTGLLVTQATVGATLSQLDGLQSTLQTNQTNIQGQISQLVDADMARAAVDFSSAQATYQAALMAASKVVQPTLLQFLK